MLYTEQSQHHWYWDYLCLQAALQDQQLLTLKHNLERVNKMRKLMSGVLVNALQVWTAKVLGIALLLAIARVILIVANQLAKIMNMH